jgi:signal transduction histidine kinase/CheY-like chemotaxis protein
VTPLLFEVLEYSTICSRNGIKITVDQNHVVQQCFPHPYIHSWYRHDIERDLIPERSVKEISQATKIKDLYFDLLKSSKKEIMLIFPSNKAFGRQERIGIISLIKQVVREKNLKVRMLVPVENLETSQELVQEPFPSKENYQQDPSNNIYIRYIAKQQSADLQETILIVDRNVSFVIELIDDTKATFEEAIGLATYSNCKSTALSYVSIFESLWKQTELYQKLNELYERLQEHHNMQKEFIIIAAHELRTPIQPILGLSEILLCKKGSVEQEKELLNVIIRNAKRLRKLTENILDVTRIESQSLTVNKQHCRLNDIITNVLVDHKKEEGDSKQRKIKFAYSSNNDNIIVKADAERLTEVVSNLLSNAIKFTQKGEISVNITRDDIDKQVIVSVTDTGQGIDPEIIPRLFTKFATKSIVGTGLGLYISKRIIEAHGGKMWAENNPDGNGATFSFTIPLVIQQEGIVIDTISTTDIEEGRKKRSIYYDSHKTKMKRIFLVDDDYDHTITFKMGLELANFQVDAYYDSAIALSKFKPDYYDLLLIDVKMPKIDGFELYEKIKEIDNKVIVWFISAYETYYRALKEASSTSKGEMISVPVIEKPIEIDKLVKQIKKELD